LFRCNILLVFGRVTQCRTGHAYTGEFRRFFLPLSQDPTTCPCDNTILETRNHIIRECPRYAQHRNILSKASQGLALSELLGTPEGIEALAEFLAKSSAFTRTGGPTPEATPPLFENEPDPDLEDYLHLPCTRILSSTLLHDNPQIQKKKKNITRLAFKQTLGLCYGTQRHEIGKAVHYNR
jgi:hypothetical protein